ncbi:energy-coupling factor transporter transmembrane component T family protein [Streptomyces bacillaris]|uniref:Energy-coupling factor transporter transmembrane protein EcfT n=1 Tax=Streptomyces cavourensis TaxID=67258 RepID=A0ABY5FIJ7_9ACTN|nr:energy-coupling factor transporter transmembrane component T [Streptomyces cavourensis]UTR83554.1 energy-coupling factor transporter transmembrane protein EcfT [Streptomyces cavourensis]
MKRTERDTLSVEWVKLELLRTAYATRGGLLARLDPRIVIFWYVLMALSPWFTHNLTILAILFTVAAAAVVTCRVGPLVVGLFIFGLVTEAGYLIAAAWLFDGDLTTVLSLAELTLKLGTVSMASMAAFVSLDPEKLSDALLSLRAPALVTFGVSYGYRMLPILVDEFQTVIDGYRLRLAPPASRGLLAWRVLLRGAKITVYAFYPMMLNTAKRTRTTVEALETRGFTYAMVHSDGRRIRLAHLKVRPADVTVLAATAALIVLAYVVGAQFPSYAQD